jgi:peroxiredoxin
MAICRIVLAGLLANAAVMFAGIAISTTACCAQDADQSVSQRLDWVPQHLLGLLHAPEVQSELGLTDDQRQKLESYFARTDGPWFRARNLPNREKYLAIAEQEKWMREQLEGTLSEGQMNRLSQVERRAQASRILLRTDVMSSLGIDIAQKQALEELFARTEIARTAAEKAIRNARPDPELNQQLESAIQSEEKAAVKILNAQQRRAVFELLGPAFDLKKLKRIYPKAPEFEGVTEWIQGEAVQMADLRGKVVAIQFYAIASSKCKANLPIYNDIWSEFQSEDFVMIGVHTPQFAIEKKLDAVRDHAAKEGLLYPIAVDGNKETWNAYGNYVWPTIYLVDREGYVRFWWQGELKWKGATGDAKLREEIRNLLNESDQGF